MSPPGQSVAVTAHETIDFRPSVVEKHYPGCALHGILSPTTDLSREGIVAPTTQVDAGYQGTFNWTLNNTSNEERRFLHKERVYRLTILKLEAGEVPVKVYDGEYQAQTGYVPSRRRGAPVGIRDSDWANASVEGGPESLLENLINSGYPWHGLGRRLKDIDEQMKMVTSEYAEIDTTLRKLQSDLDALKNRQAEDSRTIPSLVRDVLKDEQTAMQNRWLVIMGSMIAGVLGLVVSITGNDAAKLFIKSNGCWIGLAMVLLAAFAIVYVTGKSRNKSATGTKQ